VNIVELVEHLGVMGVLVFLCVMLIYKFVNTDKKVEVMHRRFDNLKDQIVEGMEETKDEIQELNKDLLRQFRNGG
jgi:energy-converting hydrogenase Eha subunit H